MDILLTPDKPTFPVPKTPFVQWDRWDCGPFLSFATRKELLRRVPPSLRRPDPAFHVPYTELLYPSPKKDIEGFYIAWFYFGLISELLGLNEGPGRASLGISEKEALERCAALYDYVVVLDEDGESAYISGSKVYQRLLPRLKGLMSASEEQYLDHISHFNECLQYTFLMLNGIHSEFDSSILVAITALGEICTATGQAFFTNLSTKRAMASLSAPSTTLKPDGIPWGSKSLRSGMKLESSLLSTGWCPSEIEKVRKAYTSLYTVHYLSRLDRGGTAQKDHSSCTPTLCKATQILLENYELSHTKIGCGCAEFEVDIDEVQHILRSTDSFPVLLVECLDDGSIRLTVEAYNPDVKYVALSHVWADGLGNPRKNAIQTCQLRRLATLVAKLQRDMEPDEYPCHGSQQYRLWIDTLCCPVEPSGKVIALQRIVQVYRDAAHVLVLDSSISGYSSEATAPVELLIRAYCTSAWMRRLWTLQEGALSKSLCFQLADRASRDYDLLKQLKAMATSDPRLYSISTEIEREMERVHGFRAEVQADSWTETFASYVSVRLFQLQWSIFFRTVTVPSDEPVCLGTLLSLDVGAIAAAPTQEDRMALLWSELARRHGGIPPRLIFAEDRPMTKPGFRWAPLSMLGSLPGSFLSANDKAIRFDMTDMDASSLGVPTPRGLRVRFAGARIGSRPLTPGFDLHPWRGMLRPQEDMLQVKHEATGTWYRLVDAELLRMAVADAPDTAEAEWHRKAGNRVCEALHGANMALLYDSRASDTNLTEYQDQSRQVLVVHIEDTYEEEEGKLNGEDYPHGALFARRFRTLVMNRLSSAEVIVAEGLRELARLLARETVTETLMAAPDRDVEGPLWVEAKEAARPVMTSIGIAFWESRPDFASAVDQAIGPGMKEFAWVMAVKSHSHDLVLLEDLSPDQTWVLD